MLRRYASARESFKLPALTALEAAEDQFAAREAWLKWIDGDYWAGEARALAPRGLEEIVSAHGS